MRALLVAACAAVVAGCSTIADLAGYVPVDVVDKGPTPTVIPSGVGLEEAVGISGAASVIASIGLNLYRNWTRAKIIKTAAGKV